VARGAQRVNIPKPVKIDTTIAENAQWVFVGSSACKLTPAEAKAFLRKFQHTYVLLLRTVKKAKRAEGKARVA
jgi:uncharacterized SAM-dependent methyltransferase